MRVSIQLWPMSIDTEMMHVENCTKIVRNMLHHHEESKTNSFLIMMDECVACIYNFQ